MQNIRENYCDTRLLVPRDIIDSRVWSVPFLLNPGQAPLLIQLTRGEIILPRARAWLLYPPSESVILNNFICIVNNQTISLWHLNYLQALRWSNFRRHQLAADVICNLPSSRLFFFFFLISCICGFERTGKWIFRKCARMWRLLYWVTPQAVIPFLSRRWQSSKLIPRQATNGTMDPGYSILLRLYIIYQKVYGYLKVKTRQPLKKGVGGV